MRSAVCLVLLTVVCMASQAEASNTTLQLLGQASILTGGEAGAGTEQVGLMDLELQMCIRACVLVDRSPWCSNCNVHPRTPHYTAW